MSTIKDRMLNLFMDNVTSDITPGDMRTLITNVFDSQENVIRKITDITVMYFSQYPIQENDLVVINEENNVNSVNGLYLATKDSPTFDDLDLINYDLNTDSILTSGGNNEILATIDGELAWIPQRTGYYLKGTKPIYDILNIVPLNLGEVFIAEDTQAGAEVPGEIGDGYSWTGSEWINIGPLKGADGLDASGLGADVALDTSNFNNRLSSADTNVQLAFETLDNIQGIIEATILSSYTPDLRAVTYFDLTVTEDTTINNPINYSKGQKGEMVIRQDATGGWNVTWGSDWIFPNGAPSLDTTPNRINFLRFNVLDTNKILTDFVADL